MRERCSPGCFCQRCWTLNRIAVKRTEARIGSPEKTLKALRTRAVREKTEKVPKIRTPREPRPPRDPGERQVARRLGTSTVPEPMQRAIRDALLEGQSLSSIALHSGHSRDKVRNIKKQMEREGLL